MARRNSYRGKYKLSKHEYLKSYHYAMCYNEWKRDYDALVDTACAIRYDDMPHAANTRDRTAEAAEKRAELREKIRMIEDTAHEADPDLGDYILHAVTNEGATYEYLQTVKKLPCGKDMFYDRRRKFYYLLNKKI